MTDSTAYVMNYQQLSRRGPCYSLRREDLAGTNAGGASVVIALAGNRHGLVDLPETTAACNAAHPRKQVLRRRNLRRTLIRPIEVGSREGLWKIFDIGVIDGFCTQSAKRSPKLGDWDVIFRPDLCAVMPRSSWPEPDSDWTVCLSIAFA